VRERPRVSVVAPVFNNRDHLSLCIESLLGQRNAGPYEVILVDNGSTDGSLEIARSRPEITLLEEAKPGAYPARNTGLRAASGSIIAFTDGDCVVDPDWLETIQAAMKDPTVGALVGHCRFPRHASRALHLLGAYENAKAEYVLSQCDRRFHFGYTNNMAVRASIFDELGPFLEWKRAGDSELVHRIAARKPELRTVFSDLMRVTHMEFASSRTRAKRLNLYTRTNSKIETFEELGLAQRIGVLVHLARRTLARRA